MGKAGESLMGYIQFLNQDGEWEEFPNEEQRANLRANAELLEEMGYKLICQLCNKFPTRAQIRSRYLLHEWVCDECGAVNSAGKP
jgi:hypothetical protein